MAHDNRGRIRLVPGGDWTKYTDPIDGFNMLAEVVVNDRPGALIQCRHDATFYHIDAGCCRTELSSRKVHAALAAAWARVVKKAA
jgi:hypothetical protein